MTTYSNLRNSLRGAGFVFVGLVSLSQISVGTQIPVPKAKPIAGIEESSYILPSNSIPLPKIKPSFSQPVSFIQGKIIEGDKNTIEISKSIFSDRQARLVREIFDLQDQGEILEADKKISQLNNNIILGHILAARYLHPLYQPSYEELAQWLVKYEDHPQASEIYNLAVSKKSNKDNSLKKPARYQNFLGNLMASSQQGDVYKSTKNRTADQDARVQKLYREIELNIKRQQPSLALNILSGDYAVQFMDDVEFDIQRAVIASGYLYAGDLDDAKRLAQDSIARSASAVPMAWWVKGLVEWQQGDYKSAADDFDGAAASKYASGWMVSAAAYWASRSYTKLGDTEKVQKSLTLAATYQRTFYGLIALKSLGQDSRFNWNISDITRDDVKLIESTTQGKRAAALIQSGRLGLAEAELKGISFDGDINKRRSLLAYAHHYNLPSLLMMLGNSFPNSNGNFYDAALYPVAAWIPKGGLKIDNALLHAFIRQESRFNYDAANPSGATGLMQLMPATANHVVGKDIYDNDAGQYDLKKPEVNLALGQKYIQELLDLGQVQNDLLSLAIAYNAGPGNLSKWKAERASIKDPLLFIETIPYPETRAFVERVMSNYWIYKIRFKEDIPSLDSLAEGHLALYAARK